MKITIILLGVCFAAAYSSKPYYNPDNAPELFEKFIKDYNKHYKDENDKKVHYKAFYESLVNIDKENYDKMQTAVFDINKFADYTHEEWEKYINGIKKSKNSVEKIKN